MSCCGNHCFSTYHPEVKLIDGNKYIEVCFPNKRRRLCVVKNIKGKTYYLTNQNKGVNIISKNNGLYLVDTPSLISFNNDYIINNS